MEWSESVTDTGKASPYIGEILDVAFSRAHATVVLFTPDDEARLKEPFRAENDPPHEAQLTGQPRPNVLFEAGIAMARSQDRTILVELGNLRPYSDIGGRYTIRLYNSTQRRQELAQRLQNAGCPAKLTGTDWHTAGDFEGAIGLMEGTHQQDTTGVSDSEEQRFAEMLTASRHIREHICGFLAPSNSNRTPVEAQNIVIALGALAGQMDALGMKELNQRLEMPMDIMTKLNRIMEMLGYFEMLTVGRNFEQAKKKLESYGPQEDDKAGYPETNDTL